MGTGGGTEGTFPRTSIFGPKFPPWRVTVPVPSVPPLERQCTRGTKIFRRRRRRKIFFAQIVLKFVPVVQIFCPKFFWCTRGTVFFAPIFLVYPGYSFFLPKILGVPGVQNFFCKYLAIFWPFLGKNWEIFFHLYHGYTFFKKNFLICTRGTVPLVICTHLFSICTRGTVPFVICTHLFSNCTRGTFQALFPPKILPGERSPGKILPQNFWVYPGYSSPHGQNTVPTYEWNRITL